MNAAAAICACAQCTALDREFPFDGRQLALIASPTTRPSASPNSPRQTKRPRAGRLPCASAGKAQPANLPPKENLTRRSLMSVTTVTVDALCISPFNPRTNEEDANAIDATENSLVARGQIYPLIVHPMPPVKGKKKQFGVMDGGRRYRAFARAIKNGRLPTNHPIDVVVRDTSDAGELHDIALAATFIRRDLRDYEVYAAVARALDRGRTLEEIAETNGQSVRTVRKWARLGNLHPAVFAALEADTISTDQALAYGATEHQDLQLKIFEQVPITASPAMIRRQLKVGDSELTKMLRFVGEKAYADAGGRYELDLFADQADQRGRVEDEVLLLQLVEAKLEAAKALLRRQAQNHRSDRDLRFETKPPRDSNFGGEAHDLEISANPVVDPADAEREAFVQDELAELVKRAELLLADPNLDQVEKDLAIVAIDVDYDPLAAELAAIDERRTLALPAGDIFATLEIEQDGALETRFWWASRKAKRDAEKPAAPPKPVSTGPIAKAAATAASAALDHLMPKPAPGGRAIDQSYGYGERQVADAAIKQEHGLTADALQVMRSLRREVLRCSLLDDAERGGTYGHDYAIWSLLRFELRGGYGFQVGARRLGTGYEPSIEHAEAVQPHVKRSLAGQRWNKEMAALGNHPSMANEDLASAFRTFVREEAEWKNAAAAFLAGLMLERSLSAPGYQIPVHDVLAAGTGLTTPEIYLYAEPTEELVDMLPKAQRLAVAQPHVDKMAFGPWAKLKAGELTAPVTRALRKAKWVHPLLRFDRPPVHPAQADVREAAE